MRLENAQIAAENVAVLLVQRFKRSLESGVEARKEVRSPVRDIVADQCRYLDVNLGKQANVFQWKALDPSTAVVRICVENCILVEKLSEGFSCVASDLRTGRWPIVQMERALVISRKCKLEDSVR